MKKPWRLHMNIIRRVFITVLAVIGFSLQMRPEAQIFTDIVQKNKKAVDLWLKSKPATDIKNDKGQTLLTVAVQQKNYKVTVACLKDRSVDINAVDSNGKTALDYAVEQSNSRMVNKLVRKGADLVKVENREKFNKLVAKRSLSPLSFMTKLVVGVSGGLAVYVTGVAATMGWAMSADAPGASLLHPTLAVFVVPMGIGFATYKYITS